MRYKVIREHTKVKIGESVYETGEFFDSKAKEVESLLKNKIVKEVRDGKAISK